MIEIKIIGSEGEVEASLDYIVRKLGKGIAGGVTATVSVETVIEEANLDMLMRVAKARMDEQGFDIIVKQRQVTPNKAAAQKELGEPNAEKSDKVTPLRKPRVKAEPEKKPEPEPELETEPELEEEGEGEEDGATAKARIWPQMSKAFADAKESGNKATEDAILGILKKYGGGAKKFSAVEDEHWPAIAAAYEKIG